MGYNVIESLETVERPAFSLPGGIYNTLGNP